MFNTSSIISATGVWQYVIFALYIVMIVVVAIICRSKSSSINEFMFSKKGVGGWLSAFAYGATYFSAVIFVGYAGMFGWNFGLSAVWIGIGNAIIGTLFAWKVLARRTKHVTQTLSARTMPELFEKRYKSKHLKLISSLVIFVFLLPYSSSVYQGLGSIFEAVIGMDAVWCVLILAALTALYLFMGGYFATSITDFIQGIIMLVGVTTMIFILISGDKVNWGEGFNTLTQNGLGILPSTAIPSGKTFLDSPAFSVTIMVLLTSFGIWALPQSVHKFYAIRDNGAIKRGTIISTIFSLIVGGGAYLTGSLVTLFVDKQTFAGELGGLTDNLMPYMLTQNLPEAVYGLIIVLLFSASMSTLAALSLSSASTVTIDFVKGYVRRDLPEKSTNILMRVLCLVFVGISAALAILRIDAIVTMMSLSWGFLAGCFIGPYVLGLYSKKINKYGAYASIISTFVVTIVMVVVFGVWQTGGGSFGEVLKSGIGRSPLIGVASMIMSLIVTPIASIAFKDKSLDSNFVDSLFPDKKVKVNNN